ncbi:MAG: penicillin-binding protein 1C [candidate division Zixibacteria bacterium]|nr:penicillin-binding protein 1C [candidate division Zixibacteria bacterium]
MARFYTKTKIALIITAVSLILIGGICDLWLFPLPHEKIQKPSSNFVYSRDSQLMGCFLSSDQFWRKPVKLDDISPLLVESVLSCEDRWFYYHPGFNPLSLVMAAIDNMKAGRVVRGGSTITMQIARMMEPKPRTVKSKLIEIFRALQLETHYSKVELLEMYFNIAPYGGNIEGVGAASYFYFDKPMHELTAAQAALLTVLPNSPTALRPDRNQAVCRQARDKVLGVMLRRGIISELGYNDALSEKINSIRTIPPDLAPHLCRDLALKYPMHSELISTIDLKFQNTCDGIVNQYQYSLKAKNISNAAVVVIDNATSEVIALVGSLDFDNDKNHGQINGATALRSPGSALKPFVYAMALDQGIITPKAYLEDLPVYYSGYSPQNYDDSYRGVVSAADALRWSLNVPAVNVCAETGMKKYFDMLKKGGISTLRGKYHDYGLPLVLGSCEVKLIELTALYSSLAKGGVYRPYKLIEDDNIDAGEKLFSEETSYIIAEILSELARPEFPSSWEFSVNIPKIAWKTGTSYGRKDAWSVGFNPDYTVGVWVGNFSAEPSPELVGAEAAAPILFDIFNTISSKNEAGWFARPADVGVREVCGVSGKPPRPHCPATVEELHIYGVTSGSRCDIHKEIMVDTSTGFKVCRYCSPGKKSEPKIYEIWPPEITTWLLKTGSLAMLPPQHNPDCQGIYYGDRPIINSPREDVEYYIRSHLPLDEQGILLDASVSSDSRHVYWFVDGSLYAEVNPGEKLFFIPEPGRHDILCSDDEGRSSSIAIKISN